MYLDGELADEMNGPAPYHVVQRRPFRELDVHLKVVDGSLKEIFPRSRRLGMGQACLRGDGLGRRMRTSSSSERRLKTWPDYQGEGKFWSQRHSVWRNKLMVKPDERNCDRR